MISFTYDEYIKINWNSNEVLNERVKSFVLKSELWADNENLLHVKKYSLFFCVKTVILCWICINKLRAYFNLYIGTEINLLLFRRTQSSKNELFFQTQHSNCPSFLSRFYNGLRTTHTLWSQVRHTRQQQLLCRNQYHKWSPTNHHAMFRDDHIGNRGNAYCFHRLHSTLKKIRRTFFSFRESRIQGGILILQKHW